MADFGYHWRQIKRRWAERRMVPMRHEQLPGEEVRVSSDAVPHFQRKGWRRS